MPTKTAEIQFSLQELRHPGSDRPSQKRCAGILNITW